MIFEKQEYQEKCVKNIIDVLSDYDFKTNIQDNSFLLNNIKNIYKQNSSYPKKLIDKKKLDILMETGTGKTFTYIKAIYEINKQYNVNKYIIFVPRKAIREGVIQNIDLTADYFAQEYSKRLVKYTYNGKQSLSQIQNNYLGNEDELSVLILTNSSIDSEKNILRHYQEYLVGEKSVLEAIKNIKPVIFIDEPHLLKGEQFTKIFSEFRSLYLRFGATFPKEEEHSLSNLVYSLDSISSFRQYLVKKIRVNTIITNEVALKVNSSNRQEAELLYFKDYEEKKITIKKNEDIGLKTGLPQYNGINIVNSTSKEVSLSNGTNLKVDSRYNLGEEEIRLMISKTIELHFEKEERNFNKGIKTLSLFFIPNVKDFRNVKDPSDDTPRIKKIFKEEYIEQRRSIIRNTTNAKYKTYLERDFDNNNNLTVHDGYFSSDRGTTAEDKEASGINLILKEKEKLLSFDSSLRFIFSVWALQEGWDNPNIFNICKLSQTDKETSRRQQVGRGLRICVNQEGKRLTYKYCDEMENAFYEYNTLDVIVSGHEKNFIEEIQKEINENSLIIQGFILPKDFFKNNGLDESQNSRLIILLEDKSIIRLEEDNWKIIAPLAEAFRDYKEDIINIIDELTFNKLLEIVTTHSTRELVENGNKRPKMIKIRENKLDEFKTLWETINRKSKIIYKDINEELLVNTIVENFKNETITKVLIRYERKEINPKTNKIEYISDDNIGDVSFFKSSNDYPEFIKKFSKDECLPLSFVLKIFNKLDKAKIENNPKEAKEKLKKIIKDTIHSNIIQSVSYSFENEIKITSLQNEDGSYKLKIKAIDIGKFCNDEDAPANFLYDKIVFDSNIEKNIIKDDPATINQNQVTVFAKLPKISIPTPYKHYNPDFAYLINMASGKTLFLVVEAKGYNNANDIPVDELEKTKYAEKFFKSLQEEMPDIDIRFKKRINQQELISLLNEFEGNEND